MAKDFIKIGNYVQLTDGVKILAHDYSYSVVTNKYNINLRPQAETILGNNISKYSIIANSFLSFSFMFS